MSKTRSWQGGPSEARAKYVYCTEGQKKAQHGEPFNVIRENSAKQGVLRGEAGKFLKGICIQLRRAWISLRFTLGVLCTTDISRMPDRG